MCIISCFPEGKKRSYLHAIVFYFISFLDPEFIAEEFSSKNIMSCYVLYDGTHNQIQLNSDYNMLVSGLMFEMREEIKLLLVAQFVIIITVLCY